MIQVKKVNENAIIPTKAYLNDAGWDLYAVEDGEILPGERKLIGTGIAMAIPPGFYGRIADRSGNAYRAGVHTLAGTCDSNYRGEIKVLLVNLSKETFSYKRGDRVAQLIITVINNSPLVVVDELDETDRNMGGFGSTGR